eukprot:CAMPEP_0113551740 /NCGR_PEP_ID=MMETSP0015_2-20120614/14688_1 /TAXON_ID=2838 /ORGANISM="Odontella" /LENGTH=284 /DNA_ID=CAMNT_0000452657 /DNA_START=22 /DNA_END=876 /DNA_ORIENTATION=- /assembly_acc=CAM_ASM_000160
MATTPALDDSSPITEPSSQTEHATINEGPSASKVNEVTGIRLDEAVDAYEAQLNQWWEALESLSGGTKDAEEMCRSVDRVMKEEIRGNDDDGGEGSGDGDETVGRKLPAAVQVDVDALSLRANVALEKSPSPSSKDEEGPAASLKLWSKAMTIVPPDRFFVYASSSSYILLGAADALQRSGKLEEALSSLRLAMFVPGTIGTPYAHYLMGRVKMELGDEDGACVELGRALYLVDGEEGELFGENCEEGASDQEREITNRAKDLARQGMESLLEEEARYASYDDE